MSAERIFTRRLLELARTQGEIHPPHHEQFQKKEYPQQTPVINFQERKDAIITKKIEKETLSPLAATFVQELKEHTPVSPLVDKSPDTKKPVFVLSNEARDQAKKVYASIKKQAGGDLEVVAAIAKEGYQYAKKHAKTEAEKTALLRMYQSVNGTRQWEQTVALYTEKEGTTPQEAKKSAAEVMKWYSTQREELEKNGHIETFETDAKRFEENTLIATTQLEREVEILIPSLEFQSDKTVVLPSQQSQGLKSPTNKKTFREICSRLVDTARVGLAAASVSGLIYYKDAYIPYTQHQLSELLNSQNQSNTQELTPAEYSHIQGPTTLLFGSETTPTPLTHERQSREDRTIFTTPRVRQETSPTPTPTVKPSVTPSVTPQPTLTPSPEPTATIEPTATLSPEQERVINYYQPIREALNQGTLMVNYGNFPGLVSNGFRNEHGHVITFVREAKKLANGNLDTESNNQLLLQGPILIDLSNMYLRHKPEKGLVTATGDMQLAAHDLSHDSSDPHADGFWISLAGNMPSGSRGHSFNNQEYIVINSTIINPNENYYEQLFGLNPEFMGHRLFITTCGKGEGPWDNNIDNPQEVRVLVLVEEWEQMQRELNAVESQSNLRLMYENLAQNTTIYNAREKLKSRWLTRQKITA